MLTTFNATYISTRAHQFVDVISTIQVDGISKGELLRILGKRITLCPPVEDQRLAIFMAAWKTIGTITNAAEYIKSVEPWTEYVSLYASVSDFAAYRCYSQKYELIETPFSLMIAVCRREYGHRRHNRSHEQQSKFRSA